MIQIVKSANNSTTIALGAAAEFVGVWDVLTSFQEVDVNLAGAPAIAPGTLFFEFSPDGVNADVCVPIVVAGPSIVPLPLRTVLPFFRVRYVNGATPLTALRLTVTLHREASGRITRLASQALDPNEPLEVNRIARSVLPDGAATEATLATRAAATDVQAVTTALAVSQPRTVTGTVAVSNHPANLTDAQLRATPVPTTVGDEIVVTRYDLASDTTNYIGKAPLGTSTATASWRIKRLQFVAGNLETKMWSSATAIWNNRAAESYT